MKGRKPEVRVARDAVAGVPCPDWLSEYAKAYWVDVVRDLSGRKILSHDNLPSVVSYCIALGKVRKAEDDLRRLGDVIEIYAMDKEGTARLVGVKPNPAAKQQNDAMSLALRLAAELGATPISRSRPSMPDDDGQDDLFDFEGGLECLDQASSTRPN
jgi:P27 family predicted phage terminase small subunit